MSLFREVPGFIVGFREGRREALEKVYWAYVRDVNRYLRALARMKGADELAQASAVADLLQEVFLRAFSPAGRLGYDGVRDYGPYLTTIARNCFIDALHARGREVATSPDDLSLSLAEIDDGLEEWCEPRVSSVLASYVRELSPELKGVYEKRFGLGLSQEDAAAALGMSRRAIRTAETALRRGLRKALARAGISLKELQPFRVDFSPRTAVSAVKGVGES